MHTDISPELETCPSHGELLKLAEHTHEIVIRIDEKLIGTYEKPGMIRDVEDLKKFRESLDETKALERMRKTEEKVSFATRLIYWLCGVIGSGAIALVWKFMDGSLKIVGSP
jgi:hypothetical protein